MLIYFEKYMSLVLFGYSHEFIVSLNLFIFYVLLLFINMWYQIWWIIKKQGSRCVMDAIRRDIPLLWFINCVLHMSYYTIIKLYYYSILWLTTEVIHYWDWFLLPTHLSTCNLDVDCTYIHHHYKYITINTLLVLHDTMWSI